METNRKSKFRKFIARLIEKNSISQFLVLVSFLITFSLTRAVTHLQKAGLLPNQDGLVHIHHLVPGIFLLLLSGYIGISFWQNQKVRNFMAILFGVGAALTIDEFALWLYLQDVYWAKQGRDSVDAAIIVIGLLILGFLISDLYGQEIKGHTQKMIDEKKKGSSK